MGDISLHDKPRLMINQNNLGHGDGIDVILDRYGKIVSRVSYIFKDFHPNESEQWIELLIGLE